MRKLVVALAISLGGCQWIFPLPDLCVTNQDCKGDSPVCRKGACLTTTEAACTPVCEGRACGPDGCGGLCAACDDGLLCDVGACVESCVAATTRCPDTCRADSGRCGCAGDDECTGGLHCDTGTGRCEACVTDAQCPGGECVNHTCESCSDNKQCESRAGGAEPICLQGRCVECGRKQDCDSKEACRISDHTCVAGECGQDADCQANERCDFSGSESACVAKTTGCTDSGSCSGDTPVCDVANHACVRCTTTEGCGSGSCVEGRCTPCALGVDCANDPNGTTCVVGLQAATCGCTSDAHCTSSNQGPHCLAGRCAPCATNDHCETPTPFCDGTGECVECAVDGDCRGSLREAMVCSGGSCSCPAPIACTPGQCGPHSNGCGSTNTCACAADEICAAQDSCVPIANRTCENDTDCGGGDYLCWRPTFPGSPALPSAPGLCAKAANCGPGELLRSGACLTPCTGDADCPANAYCGTDPQGSSRACLPGCRENSCPVNQQCDAFSARCVPVAGSAAEGTPCSPGLGSCQDGLTCLPRGQVGVCAKDCSLSSLPDCVCLRGAARERGGCEPLEPGSSGPCTYDADCGARLLCVGAGECRAACSSSSKKTFDGRDCGTECTPSPRGWREDAVQTVGSCVPLRGPTVGQACSASVECPAGQACHWFRGAQFPGSGTCVTEHAGSCGTSCEGVCILDPEAGTRSLCVPACTDNAQCGAGVSCFEGACTPNCRSVNATCNPIKDAQGAERSVTCQSAGLTNRCAPAAGFSEGTACTADAECAVGLACGEVPLSLATVGKRCRAPCTTGELVCARSGTACLVGADATSGLCAIAGAAPLDGLCDSSDDCAAGLVCASGLTITLPGQKKGACRPPCRVPGSCDATCTSFSASTPTRYCEAGTTPLDTGAPWCLPASSAETCNLCDDDHNGTLDDNIAGLGTSPLAMTIDTGTVVDTATLRVAPGWFASAWVVQFEDRIELRGSLTTASGVFTSTLATHTGTGTRATGRLVTLAGPVQVSGDLRLYVAYRLFEADNVKVNWMKLTTGAPQFGDVGSTTFTPDGKDSTNPALSWDPALGRLLLTMQERATPTYANVLVLDPGTLTPRFTRYGPVTGLSDLVALPHPAGGGALVLVVQGAFSLSVLPVTFLFGLESNATFGTPTAQATFSAAAAQRLEAVVLPGKGLVAAGAFGTAVSILATDQNLTQKGALTVAASSPPFDLAPPAASESFALLAFSDTSTGGRRLMLGGVDPATGVVSARHALGPAWVAGHVALATDGTRIHAPFHGYDSTNSREAAGQISGCQ